MRYKQVIIVRKDLNLSPGKLAVQVAHASLEAALKSDKKVLEEWRREGAKKVVLQVRDLKELLRIKELADNFGLNNVLIKDAGLTEIPPGTITCLAIGPDLEEKIDKITGNLKLF